MKHVDVMHLGLCQSLMEDKITLRLLSHAGQEKKYEVKKRRVLRGKSVPHYAALEPQGKGMMLASEKPFVFTHVDGLPVEQPGPQPMEVEKTGGSTALLRNRLEKSARKLLLW